MRNLGTYVTYKGNNYIVVGETKSQIKINGIDLKQLQVNKTSVKKLDVPPAKLVEHHGKEYLVTTKGNIFSVTTGKLMKWPENNGDRKNILSK